MKKLIIVLIVLTCLSCNNSIEKTRKDVLIQLGEKETLKRLKAPSTAVFIDSLQEIKPTIDKKNVYRVYIHVDAENSFGAKIRNKYLMLYEYKGGDSLSKQSYELKQFFD